MRELRAPYWFWFGNAFAVYLGVAAAGLARAHLLRHQSQREQAAELEARLAEAELEALRRQLDPHFLFNTLALVASLVERDPPGARRMIARLSDLLRASLGEGGEHEVPLAQELALVEVYLEIMRARFEGRLEVTTAVDVAARDALVPPLVLQPLVENAVKHGVEKVRGIGRIRIEVARAGDEVVLRVRDNGPEGPGAYTELHVGGRRHLLREAMQTLEGRLDPAKFLRVHRSAIVRLDAVESYRRVAGGDGEVVLKGGTTRRVSRTRRELLERWLGVAP